MELDLSKPLIAEFSIMGKIQRVEYENLPDICFHCGVYGHTSSTCPRNKPESSRAQEGMGEQNDNPNINASSTPEASSEDRRGYGPWMVVQKHGKQPA